MSFDWNDATGLLGRHYPDLVFFLVLLAVLAASLAITYKPFSHRRRRQKPRVFLKKAKPLDGLLRDRPRRNPPFFLQKAKPLDGLLRDRPRPGA